MTSVRFTCSQIDEKPEKDESRAELAASAGFLFAADPPDAV
jgi:hypothetical protein